jgi:hypothetical protein
MDLRRRRHGRSMTLFEILPSPRQAGRSPASQYAAQTSQVKQRLIQYPLDSGGVRLAERRVWPRFD